MHAHAADPESILGIPQGTSPPGATPECSASSSPWRCARLGVTQNNQDKKTGTLAPSLARQARKATRGWWEGDRVPPQGESGVSLCAPSWPRGRVANERPGQPGSMEPLLHAGSARSALPGSPGQGSSSTQTTSKRKRQVGGPPRPRPGPGEPAPQPPPAGRGSARWSGGGPPRPPHSPAPATAARWGPPSCRSPSRRAARSPCRRRPAPSSRSAAGREHFRRAARRDLGRPPEGRPRQRRQPSVGTRVWARLLRSSPLPPAPRAGTAASPGCCERAALPAFIPAGAFALREHFCGEPGGQAGLSLH